MWLALHFQNGYPVLIQLQLKMAVGKAHSSDNEADEEQHQRDPIQVATENGAELSKPERASISRKRKVAENKAKDKTSRMQKSMRKTSV